MIKRIIEHKHIKPILKSFVFAFSGLAHIFKNHRNARIILFIGILVLAAGVYLKLSTIEMTIIILVCGLVLIGEIFNTMLEDIVDLVTDSKFHPIAKIIKDMAAAAVLLASFLSILVGILVFFPKLNLLWR
ncbi:MAG: diacylglycerol kinase family protein [Candidatus Gygaella obscura]|nr:diacylglycerol kinase family protein [Candidatus Gygaella obscura]